MAATPRFTAKQGQYLAFIHTYAQTIALPPRPTWSATSASRPPSVHRMVVELERRGLIRRIPRQARSIALCIPTDEIPPLQPQLIETSASRY
jgi:hypothetical protein